MIPFFTTGVREINDAFRAAGPNASGHWAITAGVQAQGADLVAAAIQAVRTFDDFNPASNPWKEHDCASLNVAGQTLIWKIDCYDPTLSHCSDNAADPAITRRVLTIMMALEC